MSPYVAIATHAIVGKQETRRLREIVEIVNVNRDGSTLINTPFKWSPEQDAFYSKKESKVFEKISLKRGIPVEELKKELNRRAKLLYAVYQKKIFDFNDVQKIINNYYKNPEEVLASYGIKE